MFPHSAGIDLILKMLTWEPVFTSVGKTVRGIRLAVALSADRAMPAIYVRTGPSVTASTDRR